MSRHRRQGSLVLPADIFGGEDPPPPPPAESVEATAAHQHGPTGPVSNAPATDRHHQHQSSASNHGATPKKPSSNKPSS
ncbi:hypothetical protein Ddye_022739 [Dipteronia dyeriana]|uniref:Uncharacterized protein n=1 Tax=Dipteronia dyeriana TaxID=168575 RepID=A0AAD9TRT0_9ROSI|nr:hypothetical protein Ddye_022739 [Dipteronia dyeriana]